MGQLAPGTVVGADFRVIQALSSGGMGAIYVAEQLSTGKRRALKLMHPSLVQDSTLRDRFAQEARVGSMIASDHVVEVVGAGVDPASGAPWIAMELLEGEDLASHLAHRGVLTLREAAEILRPLCHALGAAHAANVVHRDIKPENVFLAETRSTSAPRSVKVLDFGIAKVVQQAQATATAMMGTPVWMAPEQSEAMGRVGPATDVWALGLLSFWMLTGRSYWRAAQVGAQSVHALLREVLFEPMEPASLRAQSLGVAERIAPGFDGWFAGCVAREPGQRFPDARAAYAAFARDVLGEPVEGGVTEILERSARRELTVLAAGLGHAGSALQERSAEEVDGDDRGHRRRDRGLRGGRGGGLGALSDGQADTRRAIHPSANVHADRSRAVQPGQPSTERRAERGAGRRNVRERAGQGSTQGLCGGAQETLQRLPGQGHGRREGAVRRHCVQEHGRPGRRRWRRQLQE